MKKDKVAISQKVAKLTALQQAGFHVKKFVEITEREVSEIIVQQQVPRYIIDNILKELTVEPLGVAVRSAAIGEDGQDLAWPGQFKTRLNVHFPELADAILECANAQNTPTVKAYAETHGVEVPLLKLFVQEMVNAESAGVTFTINPITGSKEMVIESVLGVADSFVSGSQQPARYYIHSESGELLRREGDEEQDVLSSTGLLNVITTSRDVRGLFKRDQDIEWAIEYGSDKIFINQSRDITTRGIEIETIQERVIQTTSQIFSQEISRLKGLGVNITRDILSDQNIAEILTPHPCFMAFKLFTYVFAHGDGAIRVARNEIGYEIGPELKKGFFYLVGGQPRCSIIHDAFTYRIKGIPLEDYCRLVDFYLLRIDKDMSLANYPEIVLYEQNPSLVFLTDLFGREKARIYHKAYTDFFVNIRQLEINLREICQAKFLPRWREKMTGYKNENLSPDITSLAKQFRELCEILRKEGGHMFVKVARLGFFAYARLKRLVKELFGDEGEKYLGVLTSGISPEFNPNLSFSIQLAALKDGSASLKDITKRFGHLSPHEFEVSVPRYHEIPEIIQGLADNITGDPFEDFQRSSERSLRLEENLLRRAGSKQRDLEREIAAARSYLSLREMVKFEFLRAYDLLRQVLAQLERLLGWEKGLIFHLSPEEVFAIAENLAFIHDTAEVRHSQWRENRSLYVPPVFDSRKLECIGSLPDDNVEKLLGIGVTSFITEGEVAVISTLEDVEAISQLRPGSILVTVTTDPGWTPALSLIGNKGGLVTEIGGVLAHGAIYAREVGMAAVLNVTNATHILKTGMKVRVNSPQNCVEIIE